MKAACVVDCRERLTQPVSWTAVSAEGEREIDGAESLTVETGAAWVSSNV